MWADNCRTCFSVSHERHGENRCRISRYHAMPLLEIHLHSNKSAEFEVNGNISYVYVFSFIAILILVIACVNFMNLQHGPFRQSGQGGGHIRKVAGSTRGDLITQFLTESVLLSFFSLVLALGIALLLLPMFNTLAGKEMHAGMLFSGTFLPMLVLLVALVGVLAGSYPAFYLSSFQPIQVLKGKIASGFKTSWLRSSLVVVQFFISIGLIICILVIYRQLDFIRSREVGFEPRPGPRDPQCAYAAGDPVKNYRKDLLTLEVGWPMRHCPQATSLLREAALVRMAGPTDALVRFKETWSCLTNFIL